MRRAKSFNDEGPGIPRALLTGFLAGAAADLVILPAVWGWLAPAVEGVADAVLRTLSPASPTPPSGTMATLRLENPLAALPGILSGGQRSAFLLAALGVLALCITIALANRISRIRWIHDGTWVGGRRAPSAPIHGDARLVSRPSELRRLTSGWREGKGPRGGSSPSASSAARFG